jgi:hypothetical protein
MQRKSWVTLTFIFLFFTLACERSVTISGKKSQTNSLESLASYAGVRGAAFASFFELQKEAGVFGERDALDCFRSFEDNLEGRSSFLLCLGAAGSGAYTPALYSRLQALRVEKYKAQYTQDTHASVALLSYLEDLTRAHLFQKGLKASWFDAKNKRFLEIGHYSEFPYNNGDILLSIGGTSISTLIPMVTQPRRRYSHAFMMRKNDVRLSTLEAIIERGVISDGFQEFASHPLNGLLVLRLADSVGTSEEIRNEIRARAVEIAESALGSPYNSAMDLSSTDSFFCSQLVAWAYSSAAREVLEKHGIAHGDLKISSLIPQFGKIYDESTFSFLKLIGVEQRVMASPGDLVASPFVEVAADYRDATALVSFWTRMLSSYHFVSMLSDGYIVDPKDKAASRLGWRVGKFHDFYSANFQELSLLPDALTGEAVSFLFAYDHNIYKPTVAAVLKKLNEKKFTEVPPWEILDEVKRHMVANDKARIEFKE